VVTGLARPGGPDWVYVPVEVPTGSVRLTVRCSYDRSAGVLDLGLFEPGAHLAGGRGGFRGWSGGARTEFTVAATEATPGYLPGPVVAGTWHVILGPYRVPPSGLDWRIEAEATAGPAPGGRPGRDGGGLPGPGPVLRDAPGWYRGDLHLHTVHSDGASTPAEVAAGAVAAGLDFVVSTDHNTPSAHSAFARLERPDLLVVPGEEVTTRAGHWGALGLPPGRWVDWRHRPGDGAFPRAARQVRGEGGLVVANHPFAAVEGGAWRFGYDDVDAVEVWNHAAGQLANDQALAAWDVLLRAGRPVVATGGSDAHRPPDRVGMPQTVVRAGRLAVADLVAGLRAGRCYLAASAAVSVSFRATGGAVEAGMGERLGGRPDGTVAVLLGLGGAAGAVVTLHGRDGPVHQVPTGPGRAAEVAWEAPLGALSYLRAEVHRPGGELLAVTNPIWFGPPGAP
jgi:hypothetical protein